MHMLWLVEKYIISLHNHPMRGDYNAEALIFEMAAAWFLDVSKEEQVKWNAVALLITWAIIQDYSTIFTSPSENNC